MRTFALAALASTAAFRAVAEADLPPVPPDLVNQAAVVCLKIESDGSVQSAFIVTPTGDAHRDSEFVQWAKHLRWPKAAPGDSSRNVWFPMPVMFGDAKPPPAATSCGPKVAS